MECVVGPSPRPGLAVNLSPEGLRFSLPGDALPLNNLCRLRVHPLFPRPPLFLEGVVVWRRPTDAGADYGLRITAVAPDAFDLDEFFNSSDARLSPWPDRRNGGNTGRAPDRRRALPPRVEPADPRRFTPLPPASPPPPARPFPDFPLSVGGREIWTGREDHALRVEPLLVEPDRAREVLAAVKSGRCPPDAGTYIFGRYAIGGSAANAAAMEAAHEAGRALRGLSLSRRWRMLEDIHDRLVEKKADLIGLMVAEGHPVRLAEWEFMGMETSFRAPTLRYFRDEMTKEIGRVEGESLYLTRKADGVVCVSPPKNAPASVSLFAAFCLLPGNALIIKPPLRTPIACMFLWKEVVERAVRANGGPPGAVNIITGHSETLMAEWLASPRVNDLFFFGDSRLGLEIGARAFQHGKKPILELSGNDFLVVWEDAPLEEAAEALLEGFLGSMQICMAPKKAIIHPAVFDSFAALFSSRVQERVRVGLPSDPRTFLTPVARLREFQNAFSAAVALGARPLLGGRRLNHRGEPDPRGVFAEATLVSIRDRDPLRFPCVAEENFFPLMPLLSLPEQAVVSNDDVFQWTVDVVNKNPYGLRTSVWTRSRVWASRFADSLNNAGLLRINSPHLRFSPYLSGNGGVGRSGGPFGEMNYPWAKTSRIQGISLRWPADG